MRDITHSVLAHKAAPKIQKTFSKTKRLITSFAVALGIAGISLASFASANGTVNWTGQGTTNGVLDTTQCDAQNDPNGLNGSYLLWVFSLGGGTNTVTSATLHLGGSGSGDYNMTLNGSEMKATTPYFNLSTLTANVTYTGDLGNGASNLVISHGCPGGTSVTGTTLKDASNQTVTEGASVPLGSVIHDTATVTLTPSAVPTGNVSFRFYGTVAACTADTTFTGGTTMGTVALNGNNPGVADPSTATSALAPGTYAFKANWPGMTGYTGSTSSCETFTVNKAQLNVTTNIHDANHQVVTSAPLGSVVHDTASLTGAVNGFATPAITFTFYTNSDCTGDGVSVVNVGADEADSALVRSAASTGLGAGSYAYKASVADDSNYLGDSSDCEPLTINKAQLTVTTNVHNASHQDITNTSVALGSVTHDTATVSGGVDGFTLPAVNFTLTTGYTDTCASGTEVANNGTEGNAVKSADSAALGAGTYAYRASVASNDNYIGGDSVCEPFTVNKAQLDVVTNIHNGVHQIVTAVSQGTMVHDTATVYGVVSGFSTPAVAFTFYTNNTCSGSGTSVANVGADEGNAALVRSANSAALSVGFYSYSASIAGNSNYLGATATCEPLTVQGFWCSPGFWATALKQNRTVVLNYLFTHTGSGLILTSFKYNSIPNNLKVPLSKKVPSSDPTLAQVLLDPSGYGGPAFNAVADYIASRLGWGGTQFTGENCPLSANGVLTVQTLTL